MENLAMFILGALFVFAVMGTTKAAEKIRGWRQIRKKLSEDGIAQYLKWMEEQLKDQIEKLD